MLRDISQHVIELTRNSAAAEANEIHISVNCDRYMLRTSVRDNGKGMSQELIENAGDPFVTGGKPENIGFGLPFFKFACEQSGGSLKIESETGRGTSVTGELEILNIDRPPIGDIGIMLIDILSGSPEMHVTLKIGSDRGYFTFDTADIEKDTCEEEYDSEILRQIRDEINENVQIIFGGVLNEIVS